MSEAAQDSLDEAEALRSLDASGVGVILLAVLLLGLAALSARVERSAGSDWLPALQQQLSERGYNWLKINIADGVATVSGEAPDVDSREFGVDAAEAALHRYDADDSVRIVVDATTMAGGAPSVGTALNTLSAAPSAQACSGAFADTLQWRPIVFDDGAILSADNQALLDALAAIAIRCKAHRIEVGGHTGRSGAADANLALSQQRAEAVRRFLTDKGAPAAQLSAHGYGSRKLLDRRRSPAAETRNRRIAFTVSAP